MTVHGAALGTGDPGTRHNSTEYGRSLARHARGPCPYCNRPRDRALDIKTDERGTVYYCHRCHRTWAENFALGGTPWSPPPRTYRPWQDKAAYLWSQSVPISGTPVETYLSGRGCALSPEDSDIRYLPAREKQPHAMLARVTDAVSGQPISLHFTRLAPDGRGKAGTNTDKMLLSGHRKKGGVIRLWPDEAVTNGLAIGEGIESALCAARAFTPVWAAIDADNLASFPVLAGIEALLIVADNDISGTGQRAARQCAGRWYAAGCEVRIALSRTPGHDAADEVAA